MRSAISRLGCALVLAVAAPVALCQTINVLWYTYSHPGSEYREAMRKLADAAPTFAHASGLGWKLTFFGPDSPPPRFGDYNVLVIQSGESYFTGARDAAATKANDVLPDYRGILRNKAAIEAARGERTFISGSDADVHAIQGATGNAPQARNLRDWKPGACSPVLTGESCWDGAVGHLINAVNWAGSGRGLGIVSLVAAEFPGSMWWSDPNSFLRAELDGKVTVFWDVDKRREDAPVVPEAARRYPLNHGLTTKGLGNWKSSFHAGFARSIRGYTPIVDSTLYPGMAVAIATEKFAGAGANGPP